MSDISASEARKQFASLLKRAASGESFTIVREGYPVAMLGPIVLGADTHIGVAPNYRPAAQAMVVSNTTPTIATNAAHLSPKPPWSDAEHAALVKDRGANSPEAYEYQATHAWKDEK